MSESSADIVQELPGPPNAPIWVFEYGTTRTNREYVPTGREEALEEIERIYGQSFRGRRELSSGERWRHWFGASRPKASDLEPFFTQLANQVRQEQEMSKVLYFQGINSSNLRLRWIALEMAYLQSHHGKPLSECMAAFPEVFTAVHVGAVRAGEESNRVAEVLAQLARDTVNAKRMRSEVVKACIMPAITMSIVYLSIIVMCMFLLPRLEDIYISFGAQNKLPFATRIMANASHVCVKAPWVFGIGPAVLVFAFTKRKQIARSQLWSTMVQHLPFVGGIFRQIRFAGMVRTLALLVEHKVDWKAVFTLTASSCDDARIRGILERSQDSHNAGMLVQESVWEFADHFGNLGLRLQSSFATGVGFNSLAKELTSLSVELDEDCSRKITTIGKPLEAGLILVSAMVIMGMVISAYLPVFKLAALAT